LGKKRQYSSSFPLESKAFGADDLFVVSDAGSTIRRRAAYWEIKIAIRRIPYPLPGPKDLAFNQ